MARVTVIVGTPGSGALLRSDLGAIAIAAQRLGGPFDAVTLTDREGRDEAMRVAIASGASTARRVERVEEVAFDIALIGAGGAGDLGDALAARLAIQRGAALCLEVIDVASSSDGLLVTRDLGHGAREVISISGPAVLAISEEAARGPYVSRYRRGIASVQSGVRQAAKTGTPWEPARPRTKTSGIARKTGGSATDRMHATFGVTESVSETTSNIVQGDSATCAKHLLRFLSHHGLIQRRAVESDLAPTYATPQTEPRATTAAAPTLEAANDAVQRGPRPLDGNPRGMRHRPRPANAPAVLPRTIARGPRAVEGVTRGIARRPRPVVVASPISNDPVIVKLSRAPRSLEPASRRAIRGPFPVR